MNKENYVVIDRENMEKNVSLYPNDWPLDENGQPTEEAIEFAKTFAESNWENLLRPEEKGFFSKEEYIQVNIENLKSIAENSPW